jgi:hypothetical protein
MAATPAMIAALSQSHVAVRWYAYMDIVGDVMRAVSGQQAITFAPGQTGDPDLDGQTFAAVSSDLVHVGDPRHSEGGSNTLQASLRGLPVEGIDLINTVGNRAAWYRREARLWMEVLTPDTLQPVGPPEPYYSGDIVDMYMRGARYTQDIFVEIENFIAVLTRPSNKTYLHQGEYDAGDDSAARTLAAMNGMQKAGVHGRPRTSEDIYYSRTPGGGAGSYQLP